MALQTVPPHVYDTQDETEMSFVDTGELDYTPNPNSRRTTPAPSARPTSTSTSAHQHQAPTRTQHSHSHQRSTPQPFSSNNTRNPYINDSSTSADSLPSTIPIVSEPDLDRTDEERYDDEEPLFTGRLIQRRATQIRDTESSPDNVVLISSSSTSRGSLDKSQRLATLEQLREQRSQRQPRYP